jgi:hypothetical protein
MGKMKKYLLFLMTALVTMNVSAQEFVRSRPAGRNPNAIAALAGGLAAEGKATVRDLVTFRDPRWTVLTIAQIAASTADGATSLHTFHRCPTCLETGISRFVVGRRPDAHKYIIAGIVEIGVEAVAAHYLRSHGPIRKWYWRYVWTLPQSLSRYEHTRADFHNIGLHLTCDPAGLNCF